MAALESYQYRDPMLVLMRKQESERLGRVEVISPFGEKVYLRKPKNNENKPLVELQKLFANNNLE